MIKITAPKPKDTEGMNEVIKLSWYATYITPEIGVTKDGLEDPLWQRRSPVSRSSRKEWRDLLLLQK